MGRTGCRRHGRRIKETALARATVSLSALPHPSLDAVPEDLRSQYIFGEDLSMFMVPTALVTKLGRRGVQIVIDPNAGRFRSFAGNWINGILRTAGQRTGTFVATEAMGAQGAALGGAIAEELDPGDLFTRIGSEVVGGFLSPTRLMAGLVPDAKNALVNRWNKMKLPNRISKLSEIVRRYAETAGESPEAALAYLRTVQIPGEITPTAGQLLGDSFVARMEREMSELSREFGVQSGSQAKAALEGLARVGVATCRLRNARAKAEARGHNKAAVERANIIITAPRCSRVQPPRNNRSSALGLNLLFIRPNHNHFLVFNLFTVFNFYFSLTVYVIRIHFIRVVGNLNHFLLKGTIGNILLS